MGAERKKIETLDYWFSAKKRFQEAISKRASQVEQSANFRSTPSSTGEL